MVQYKKLVSKDDKRFKDRETVIMSTGGITRIPIPNDEIICNGCNGNILNFDGEFSEAYFIYFSKTDLKNDRPYDVYCKECSERIFPKAVKVS